MNTKAFAVLSAAVLAFGLFAVVNVSAVTVEATGVIREVYPSGFGGIITVIQGGPTTVNPGDTISFAEDTAATEGDLVSFTATVSSDGTTLATGLVLEADGTLFTGAQNDVNVGVNQVVVLEGVQVEFDVVLESGAILIIAGGSTVNGKVEGDGAAFLMIEGGSLIMEATEVKNGQTVIIIGPNTFNGDIEVKNTESVIVTDNMIDDDVEVKNSPNVTITGNTIAGDLEVEGATLPSVSGNTVSGTTEIS